MKALKEKRVSLRSFLRRGLVILSLFALVFASCSESGGEEGGSDPTGGQPTTTPPRKVDSVRLLSNPVNHSFQGARIDLRGIQLEIKYSDSSDPVYIRTVEGGEWDKPETFVIEGIEYWENLNPQFCDVPSYQGVDKTGLDSAAATYAAGGAISKDVDLYYTGFNTAIKVKVPHVVPVDKIELSQPPSRVLYADVRPEFEKAQFDLVLEHEWVAYVNGKLIPDQKPYRVRQYMTDVYPVVDYTNASNKTLKVSIGTGTSQRSTTWLLDNYYEVYQVLFRKGSADWTKGGKYNGFYDDDIDVFFDPSVVTATGIAAGTVSADPTRVLPELRKTGIEFDVYYVGLDQPKTITLDQFIGNARWYSQQRGIDISSDAYMREMVVGTTGLKVADSSDVYILRLGEADPDDENMWEIWLDYAPWILNKQANVNRVIVPVQVFGWEGDIQAELKKVGGSFVNNPVLDAKQAERQLSTGSTPYERDELEAIAASWTLTASYSNGELSKQPSRKPVKLTERIFYDGFYGVSLANLYEISFGHVSAWSSLVNQKVEPLAADPDVIQTQLVGGMSAYNSSYLMAPSRTNSIQINETFRNYVLPVYYRGEYIYDTDDGIRVDLIGKD